MISALVIISVVAFLFANASLWACVLLAGKADQEVERISQFQPPACRFPQGE